MRNARLHLDPSSDVPGRAIGPNSERPSECRAVSEHGRRNRSRAIMATDVPCVICLHIHNPRASEPSDPRLEDSKTSKTSKTPFIIPVSRSRSPRLCAASCVQGVLTIYAGSSSYLLFTLPSGQPITYDFLKTFLLTLIDRSSISGHFSTH